MKAALILFNLFSVIFLLFVLYYFWKILSNSSSSRFIGLSICAGVFLDEPALHVESAFGWLQPFFGCGVSKDLNASFCVCSSVLLSSLGPGSPRPGGLFGAETNELILRFMWKCNRSRVTKTLLNSSTKLEASHETDCDATSQNGMALASGETGSGGPTRAAHAHARLHTCTPAHMHARTLTPRTLMPTHTHTVHAYAHALTPVHTHAVHAYAHALTPAHTHAVHAYAHALMPVHVHVDSRRRHGGLGWGGPSLTAGAAGTIRHRMSKRERRELHSIPSTIYKNYLKMHHTSNCKT